MASLNERRENGDGSYSINVALTDADGILQVDVQPRPKRIVLGMQGTSLGAGATLSQNVDLTGCSRAVFGAIFSAALTGSMALTNTIGNLWVGGASQTLTANVNGQTGTTFAPMGVNHLAYITNTGASAVTINTAEVIAQ